MNNEHQGYKITEEGKAVLIDMLNQSLGVEYDMVASYPRLVVQLINMHSIPHGGQLIKDMKRLGDDSVKHANQVIRMIELIGGEPYYYFGPLERSVDISEAMSKQLEKEKLAYSLCGEMRRVAEDNLDNIDTSKVISILKHQQTEEFTHIMLINNIISALNYFALDREEAFARVGNGVLVSSNV